MPGSLLQLTPGDHYTYSPQLLPPLSQVGPGLSHAQSLSCCFIETQMESLLLAAMFRVSRGEASEEQGGSWVGVIQLMLTEVFST